MKKDGFIRKTNKKDKKKLKEPQFGRKEKEENREKKKEVAAAELQSCRAA